VYRVKRVPDEQLNYDVLPNWMRKAHFFDVGQWTGEDARQGVGDLCQSSRERSATAAALIDDLSAAFRAGELANALPAYTHAAALVVDEVGYLTYGTDAANMLFHVANERHRRHRPMIFTTNKSLKA
jgi:hypothetical protein